MATYENRAGYYDTMKTDSGLQAGFTLIELVMIIVLLTIISVAVVVKWPTGMDSQAAKLEFVQVVRYAKHMAMTRQWTGAASAWGVTVVDNKYYVGRAGAKCKASCANTGCADDLMCNRYLLGSAEMTLSPNNATLFFNGLGEPIDTKSGALVGNSSFTIAGSELVTVCAETGYVMDGGSCP